jgi:hypothetical protein
MLANAMSKLQWMHGWLTKLMETKLRIFTEKKWSSQMESSE